MICNSGKCEGGIDAYARAPRLVDGTGAFGAYHYGPGQEKLRLDDVSRMLAEADRLAAAEQWRAASARYEEALAILTGRPA